MENIMEPDELKPHGRTWTAGSNGKNAISCCCLKMTEQADALELRPLFWGS